MKIVDTFTEFVVAAADVADADKPRGGQRVGQAVFNLLDKVRPDLALMVNNSDYDPFFDDSRLPLFYDFLFRNW